MLSGLQRKAQNVAARKLLVAWPKVVVRGTKYLEPVLGQLSNETEREQVRQAYASLFFSPPTSVTIDGASAFIRTMVEVEGQIRLAASTSGCRCDADAKVVSIQPMPGNGVMVHVASGHEAWCPLIGRLGAPREEAT